MTSTEAVTTKSPRVDAIFNDVVAALTDIIESTGSPGRSSVLPPSGSRWRGARVTRFP